MRIGSLPQVIISVWPFSAGSWSTVLQHKLNVRHVSNGSVHDSESVSKYSCLFTRLVFGFGGQQDLGILCYWFILGLMRFGPDSASWQFEVSKKAWKKRLDQSKLQNASFETHMNTQVQEVIESEITPLHPPPTPLFWLLDDTMYFSATQMYAPCVVSGWFISSLLDWIQMAFAQVSTLRNQVWYQAKVTHHSLTAAQWSF